MSWINGPSIGPSNLHVGDGGSATFLDRLSDTMLARAEEASPAPPRGAGYQWMSELRLMHPGQAAKHLGVGRGTVLAWARQGWIRYSTDGGRYHHAYSSEDVLELAERMRGRGIPSAHLIRTIGWPDRGGRGER